MAQLISNKISDKKATRRARIEMSPPIVIAVVAVLLLLLLGAGWKYFASWPSTNRADITMPVEG